MGILIGARAGGGAGLLRNLGLAIGKGQAVHENQGGRKEGHHQEGLHASINGGAGLYSLELLKQAGHPWQHQVELNDQAKHAGRGALQRHCKEQVQGLGRARGRAGVAEGVEKSK